jgi:hypothetical protein
MGNIFKNTSVKYYQVPQALNDSGALSRLSHVALRLYLHTLRTAQIGKGHPRVESPQWQIKQYTGIHHSGLLAAIEELKAEKLIEVQRSTHNAVIFCVCDPATGQALPGGLHRVQEKSRQHESDARKTRKKRKEEFADLPRTGSDPVRGFAENPSRISREPFADLPRTEPLQVTESSEFAGRLSEPVSDRGRVLSESETWETETPDDYESLERAAILEYDGSLSRAEAEAQAGLKR